MIEMKTAELIGPALDWAVAESICAKPFCTQFGFIILETPAVFDHLLPIGGGRFHPSSDWSLGGPLIDKHRMSFWGGENYVYAVCAGGEGYGPAHLVAACRAIVSASLGERVQVPSELVA